MKRQDLSKTAEKKAGKRRDQNSNKKVLLEDRECEMKAAVWSERERQKKQEKGRKKRKRKQMKYMSVIVKSNKE